MAKISIRQASINDMQKILEYIRQFMLDDENALSEQFIIAEVDDDFAGFGRVKPYNGIYELSSLGVLENYRNIGVGAKIVRHILDSFQSEEIWLTTKISDYFLKFGFQIADNPPFEIKNKCRRVCGSSDENKFMLLKR
jgi:N-acetylglutamate synthase-like GNAT family acetyltransferase